MILSITSEKGGVGKTTIAWQIAILMAQGGKDLLLVDADPQGSISEVASIRSELGKTPAITCISLFGKGVSNEIRKLKSKYTDIVIDCGGRDSDAMRSSILVSDKVLVPVLPGPLDAWTLDEMDSIIDQALNFNESLQGFIVLNKIDTNPKIKMADAVADFTGDLKNLKLLNSRLGYRITFRRSIAEGLAINEIPQVDLKAIQEIKNLYKEVVCNGQD